MSTEILQMFITLTNKSRTQYRLYLESLKVFVTPIKNTEFECA